MAQVDRAWDSGSSPAGSLSRLYVRTAARTITWAHGAADGAELSAVAATLGIAHPPGYPLYTLIGHLFSLIPAGEVAFRLALFSAVAASVGVALATHIVLAHSPRGASRTSSLVGAIAAGLALAVSPMYWSQGTVPEVMALGSAFVLALMALLLAWRPGRDGILVAAVFVLGLGLANHVTIAFLGGVCAIYVTAQDPAWLRRKAMPLALVAARSASAFTCTCRYALLRTHS